MLAFIRKWLTSWPVLALLALVLIAFVVTGVGDPFGRGGAGGAGGDLARVGRTGITQAAVLDRFERAVAQARAQNPALTQAQAAREGGIEQVTQGLAQVAALGAFADAHGIAISDRQIDGAIASTEAFQLGGKFDQATYERVLAQQRLNPRTVRDEIRSEIVRRQLLVPVSAGATVPREVALPYARLLLDLHEGAGATLPPPAVAPPTPAQLSAYYTANRPRFTRPERRGFRYAPLDRGAIAAKVVVADAEVQKEFDKNREVYGAVEQRRLVQLVLPDQARANAFAATVRGGGDFAAAAARATGASATDIALGALTRERFAAATNAALATLAFGAPAGGVVGPVKTDFGWNVAKVEGITPAGRTLADVRPLIVAKLRDSKTEAAMADLVARIEDGLSGGKSFADTVKENALTAQTVAPVAKDGVGAPLAATAVAAKAFDLDPADGATVVDLGGGRFALVELGQIVAPAPAPLAEIVPQVTAAWTLEQQVKAGKALAEAIIGEVGKGKPFAAALAARGLPAAKPIRGRRLDVLGQRQVPPPIALFLTLPAGATKALAANDGTMVVIHVDTVIAGDAAAAEPVLKGLRQQLVQSAADETAAAFGRAVEREVGITLNPAAIAATKARVIGDAAGAAR